MRHYSFHWFRQKIGNTFECSWQEFMDFSFDPMNGACPPHNNVLTKTIITHAVEVKLLKVVNLKPIYHLSFDKSYGINGHKSSQSCHASHVFRLLPHIIIPLFLSLLLLWTRRRIRNSCSKCIISLLFWFMLCDCLMFCGISKDSRICGLCIAQQRIISGSVRSRTIREIRFVRDENSLYSSPSPCIHTGSFVIIYINWICINLYLHTDDIINNTADKLIFCGGLLCEYEYQLQTQLASVVQYVQLCLYFPESNNNK